MADWVTGKVTKVQNWTDALFSLTVHAPVLPFTAGQFTKLGLEIDGERVQRAYSYVNSPDNPDLEFYLVTVPDGKLSPRLAALKPGDEVQVVSEAAGFFVLDEVPHCETLWMLATGTAIGPYLSILQLGKDLDRFKNLVLVHAARYAADLSYLPLMQELEKRSRTPGRASDEMCAFVVLNTASIQLIPSTLIGIRASMGSAAPAEIILPVWLVSIAAATAGIAAVRLCAAKERRRGAC